MRRDTRAQTTLDLVIGISIFLAVVAGVFLFVPGALEPYSGGAQEEIVSVNRVADTLTQDTLAKENKRSVLDTDCTVAYFDTSMSIPSSCDIPGSTLKGSVGLSSSKFINLTVQGNVTATGKPDTLLCWGTSGQLLPAGSGSCSFTFARGDDPPSRSGSSATVRRTVDLNGKDVFLVVKVW